MSSEERGKAEPCAGTLTGCLVEGDAEQKASERKIKCRAITISIALQTAGLVVLVIAPLLAKPAELVMQKSVPIPSYTHHSAPQRTSIVPRERPHIQPSGFFAPTRIPEKVSTHDEPQPPGEPLDHDATIEIPGAGPSTGPIDIIDTRRQPPPPDTVERKRLIIGHIDPALLTRRVEPVFPALARQLHRNGKVELRAVIATDGSVQSLEVVSGDPLFITSAMEAVRQWHYKPTYLNGQAVEIDTFITVIYTLQ